MLQTGSKILKKFVLGMILSLSMLGAADADAVPKYNASCMFNGCGGVSDEGERAIFTFDDMYPGPDADFDIYQRVNGETSKLIDYPEGKYRQAQLEFVSDNARRAIVETRSPLTPDDTDGWGNDFFAVQDGVPELISWDPADPSTKSENIDLQLIDATDDGRTLYFYRFPPGFPPCIQVWKRTEDAFTQVPTPNCWDNRIFGVSKDGGSTFMGGLESPWRFKDGETTPVNDIPYTGGSHCTKYTTFGDSSPDGETWVFSTDQQLVASDTDGDFDIYMRHEDGSYEMLTDENHGASEENCGDRDFETIPVGLSSDQSKVLYVTHLPVSPEDEDSELDVYLHTPQGDELISTGPEDDSPEVRNPVVTHRQARRPESQYRVDGSQDLSVIAFDSEQALVPEDTDDDIDVYAWIDGQIRLISTGPNPVETSRKAKLLGVSNDGTTISFSTPEPLLPVDTDLRMDIYAFSTDGLYRPGDAPASASASARKKKRRVVLVSAESIAPRMKVIGRPRAAGRRAVVRLRCPKAEQTGPCRGILKVRFAGAKAPRGQARFRIKAGKTKRVAVKLNRNLSGQRRARLRIKAWDRLGNTAHSTRRISFR